MRCKKTSARASFRAVRGVLGIVRDHSHPEDKLQFRLQWSITLRNGAR
jgi:hypothetical protein